MVRTTYKKICKFCKNRFNIEDRRQIYCCKKCYKSDKNIGIFKRIKCQECGKAFKEDKHHKKIKFCSKSCARKKGWKNDVYNAEVRKRMGTNSGKVRMGQVRVERIIKICPVCNKKFSHIPNYARQVTFCSTKCSGEYRGKIYCGELSPCWMGGKSFEPYDKAFNDNFKRRIRQRDNQICMLCGIHREKMKRALNVHHIDYDKLNTIQENCLCLCLPCHLKTNANRNRWTKFLQSLLAERYNYKY